MYYAKFENKTGIYVDCCGVRYDVCEIRRLRNAHGINVGYEPFDSLEEALRKWNLSRKETSRQDLDEVP